MAKRSNKTTHVLNLITNRTGISAEELENSALPETEAGAEKTAAMPGIIDIPGIVDMPDVVDMPSLADMTDSADKGDVSDHIRANLEKVEKAESKERAIAQKARTEERKRMYEEKLKQIKPAEFPNLQGEPRIESYDPENFDEAAATPEATEPLIRQDQPEPLETQAHADPAETQGPLDAPTDKGSAGDYVLVNILEEVIRMEAPKIMAELDVCRCEKCVNDVMALALNNMPPKYVVSKKGALFAKIASYGKQYQTDIFSSVTQASVIVKNSPNHQ